MTNQEKQALSQAVADKYGIEAYVVTGRTLDIRNGYTDHKLWLADDWARLMPLAVEHKIVIKPRDDGVSEAGFWKANKKSMPDYIGFYERNKDHTDEYEAVRIAICRALIEKD